MADKKKHNNYLNKQQLHILTLLYKFRYTTIPLLTEYKNLKSNSLQRTLDILLDQAYVGRKFDISYKIDRKPAVYYLVKRGIATLTSDERFNPSVLHAYYKNKSLSDQFMQHTIDTLAVYNRLHQTYGDTYQIFTKQELTAFDEFPENKPDLFLRGDHNNHNYFITLAHDIQPYLTRKRLAEYIDHSEDEGWDSGQYPTLLFVLADSNQERRLLEFAKNTLDSAGIDLDELQIGVTTIKALISKPRTSTVWTYLGENSVPETLEP